MKARWIGPWTKNGRKLSSNAMLQAVLKSLDKGDAVWFRHVPVHAHRGRRARYWVSFSDLVPTAVYPLLSNELLCAVCADGGGDAVAAAYAASERGNDRLDLRVAEALCAEFALSVHDLVTGNVDDEVCAALLTRVVDKVPLLADIRKQVAATKPPELIYELHDLAEKLHDRELLRKRMLMLVPGHRFWNRDGYHGYWKRSMRYASGSLAVFHTGSTYNWRLSDVLTGDSRAYTASLRFLASASTEQWVALLTQFTVSGGDGLLSPIEASDFEALCTAVAAV